MLSYLCCDACLNTSTSSITKNHTYALINIPYYTFVHTRFRISFPQLDLASTFVWTYLSTNTVLYFFLCWCCVWHKLNWFNFMDRQSIMFIYIRMNLVTWNTEFFWQSPIIFLYLTLKPAVLKKEGINLTGFKYFQLIASIEVLKHKEYYWRERIYCHGRLFLLQCEC